MDDGAHSETSVPPESPAADGSAGAAGMADEPLLDAAAGPDGAASGAEAAEAPPEAVDADTAATAEHADAQAEESGGAADSAPAALPNDADAELAAQGAADDDADSTPMPAGDSAVEPSAAAPTPPDAPPALSGDSAAEPAGPGSAESAAALAKRTSLQNLATDDSSDADRMQSEAVGAAPSEAAGGQASAAVEGAAPEAVGSMASDAAGGADSAAVENEASEAAGGADAAAVEGVASEAAGGTDSAAVDNAEAVATTSSHPVPPVATESPVADEVAVSAAGTEAAVGGPPEAAETVGGVADPPVAHPISEPVSPVSALVQDPADAMDPTQPTEPPVATESFVATAPGTAQPDAVIFSAPGQEGMEGTFTPEGYEEAARPATSAAVCATRDSSWQPTAGVPARRPATTGGLQGVFVTAKGRRIPAVEMEAKLLRLTRGGMLGAEELAAWSQLPRPRKPGLQTKAMRADEVEAMVTRLTTPPTDYGKQGKRRPKPVKLVGSMENGTVSYALEVISARPSEERTAFMVALYGRCREAQAAAELKLASKYLQPLTSPKLYSGAEGKEKLAAVVAKLHAGSSTSS